MTSAQQLDFSKGSIFRHILRLAGPMTLAQLINVLYNIVDRIFVGQIGGEGSLALTGLGVCFPVITIVIAFTNLIGMGGAPLFSITRGAGDDEEAARILANSFTLLLLFGVLLTAAGLAVKTPLLRALGASDATLPYADAYLTVYLFGSVFVSLSLGLNSFINAQGFARTGMLTVAIGAVLNLILDPLFIMVFHMGVQGAALATILSQAVSAAWTLRFLTGRKTLVCLSLQHMRLGARRVGKILALGLSGFIMAITNSLVQMACNASLQAYGGDIYVGVMTVINSVREVAQMPVNGVTNSAQPVISFNYGAKEPARVRQAIRCMSVIVILYTAAIWALLFPGVFYPHFQPDARFGGSRRPRHADLLFRLFHDGAAILRTVGVYGAWEVKARHLFLPVPQSGYRHPADPDPSSLFRLKRKRRVFVGADLQLYRRDSLFCHHAAVRLFPVKKGGAAGGRIGRPVKEGMRLHPFF